MRAVMIEVPEHLLQERRRRGEDRRDEMWEGVLHMVPQPIDRHQRLGADLLIALAAPSKALGLIGSYETQLFRPGFEHTDYRVPDLVYTTPDYRATRGVAGRAELVIEIRSPGDESYEKVPFYADLGCQDVLIIDRDTLALDLFVRGERQPAAASYQLASLGVTLSVIDGRRLVVSWQGGETEIVPA